MRLMVESLNLNGDSLRVNDDTDYLNREVRNVNGWASILISEA